MKYKRVKIFVFNQFRRGKKLLGKFAWQICGH